MKTNYLITVGEPIRWIINEDTSKFYKFKSNKDLALVNPLFYSNNGLKSTLPSVEIIYKKGQNYLTRTNGLILKLFSNSFDFEEFEIYISNLFHHIKSISKQQISVQNLIHAYKIVEINNLKKITKNTINGQYKIRSDFYNTMISWNMIKDADKRLKANISSPIYIEIFLDALNGLINRDYRKSILYFAIATESMMAIELDNKYELELSKKKKNSKFRIVQFETSKTNNCRDPVYQKLREPTNFSMYLHERPLYLFGRSLFLENENLYQSALRLYSTRNKITHRGEPAKSANDFLSIDAKGAFEAYNTANQLFKWMDIYDFEEISPFTFIDL